MKHRKGYRKLNKPTDQRKALLSGIALGLLKNGKVRTSRDRAKETRRIVERIVSLSKKGGLSAIRQSLTLIPDRAAVLDFFKSAPERFKDNHGGVTRITNIGLRRGDNADMVVLELI